MQRPRVLTAVVLLLSCLGTAQASETVYQWRGPEGQMMLTTQRPAEGVPFTRIDIGPNNISDPVQARPPAYPSSRPAPQNSGQSNQNGQGLAGSGGALETQKDPSANTEGSEDSRDCEAIYGMPCEQVDNWEQWAREQCGDDSRCDDPSYLERKYKPVPLADTLKIAQRAALRKNRLEREFTEYLVHTFTDMCEVQTRNSCPNLENTRDCDLLLEFCTRDFQYGSLKNKLEKLTPDQRKQLQQLADQYVSTNSGNLQQLHYLLRKAVRLMLLPAAI